MYIQKRQGRDGIYYSFSYIDEKTGKRTRLKKSQHPYFSDYAEAEAWAKSQNAYKASMKANIERRLAWKKKYYQFDELLEKYMKYQKKQAPNSYKNSRIYMERYVLAFFLNIKKANNVNMWHMFFAEFRDWLQDEARTTRHEHKLAYATSNHIIRTLNTFLTFLDKYNLMNHENNITCTCFPESMLNYRDYSDVIEEQEFNLILFRLRAINNAAADFYYVMYHTGMRFNELFSLPMSGLYSGELSGPLDDELKIHKIKYYGYVVLESQCASDTRVRNEDGSLDRKPLKGRANISNKNNRTVPIMDKQCWNILARRFKVEQERREHKEFGIDKLNYILFEDLKYNEAVKHLRQVYEELSIEAKPYHCCRHTFATMLVGRTRSYFLARTILGHRSDAFDRYNHIYEQIAIKARQNLQEIDEIA